MKKELLTSLMFLIIFCLSLANVSAIENTTEITQLTQDIGEITIIDDNIAISQDEAVLSSSEIYVNSSAIQTGDGSQEFPYASISEAINSAVAGDTVYIASGKYFGSGNVALTIDKELTLKSLGENEVILDGESNSQIFNVTSSNVVIDGLTFINGKAKYGAAIYYDSGSTNNIINNSKFINNYASSCAGAIFYSSGENSQILNSVFENNSAYSGGAILYWFDSINNIISNCNFTDNDAFGDNGGAIYFYYGSSNSIFNNVSFNKNTALYWGGAVYYYWTVENITFSNSNFIGNVANYGPALYSWYVNSLNFTDTGFIENKASSTSLIQTVDKFNHTISALLEGGNNIVNGIYSSGMDNLIFSNVTYWYNGSFVNSDKINPVYSTFEAGQNLTCEIYDSTTNELIFNETMLTDENGSAIFNYSNVSSQNILRYVIYHAENDYYSPIESSDEFNPVMGDFELLQYMLDNAAENDIINLTRNFTYTVGIDTITDGVRINKNNLTINGNGYSINALGQSRIFYVSANTININNVTLMGGYSASNGGAIIFSVSSINSTFNNVVLFNNTAKNGGAVYLVDASGNEFINSTFENNSGLYGGAVYASGVFEDNIISNSNFMNNSVNAIYYNKDTCNNLFEDSVFTNNARSIYFGGVSSNNDFVNLKFFNDTASKQGGSLYFKKVESNDFVNLTFVNNSAGSDGGAIFFESDVQYVNFTNVAFENNLAAHDGGAIAFDEEGLEFSDVLFVNASFINNNATRYGGSISYANVKLTDIKISDSQFINNSAKNGGAISYVGCEIEDVDYINVSFINNLHNGNSGSTTGGGAISYYDGTTSTNERIINSTFVNNSASYGGGAIFYYGSSSENYIIINTTFVNNSATYYGGAIYLGSMQNGELYNITCINNSADAGGAIYFIRDCSNNEISNSIFINNSINAIRYYNGPNGDTIINSVFIDNGNNEIIYSNSNTLTADYNWFGNNASNYDTKPYVSSKINLTNWLFLNATLNSDEIKSCEKAIVNFILGVYNSTSGDIIDYNYSELNQVILNLTAENGQLDKNNALIGEDITYSGKTVGHDNITAKFLTAYYTINLTVVKGNSYVNVNNSETTYGEVINLIANCSNAIGVKAKLFDENKTEIDANISIDGFNIIIFNLNAGMYTLNVTTLTDENYYNASNSSNIVVNKAPSSVIIDNTSAAYGPILKLTADAVNATGITAKIYDKNNAEVTTANITINNFDLSISNLDVGNYILNITTLVNTNYLSSTNTSTIKINKTNSSIYVEDFTGSWGVTLNLTVICENATGILAKIYDENGTDYSSHLIIDEFNLFISDLDVGDYIINVTTIVNNNHYSSTNTSNLYIRTGSSVVVEDIAIKYGENISIVAICDNATGITAKIYDKNNIEVDANITVDGFKIFINGLNAGYYTLKTTSIVMSYYAPVTNSSSIFVSKAESTISINDSSAIYGQNISVVATCENATGVNAVIYDNDGFEVPAEINIVGFEIVISNICAGNYTLNVTTINDDNHLKSTNLASLIINKADLSLILTNITNINVGESEIIVVELSEDDVVGVLIYKINNETFIVENNTITLTGLSEGTYTIHVSLINDTNYNDVSNQTTFNVNKVNSTIGVHCEDINVDETAHVSISIPGDATGNITLIINDDSQVIDINNDTVKGLNGILVMLLSFDNLTAGNYVVIATYNGNNKYNPSKVTSNFTVSKIENYTFDLSFENNTLKVNIIDDATGNITIKIANSTFTQEIVNGSAIFDLSQWNSGDYNVVVSYPGNYKYVSVSDNITVSIIGGEVNLISPQVIKYFGGLQRLYVYLTDYMGNGIYNQSIIITINGVSYVRMTDKNGTASIAINLNSGEYDVSVVYNGNDYYDSADINTTVIVKSAVNGTDVIKVFRNGTQYYATFRDADGNYLADGTAVTFNINGVYYTRYVNGNGLAKLNINLHQGEYIITAINPLTNEYGSNIITVISKIVENNNLVKYYKNDSQYIVRLVNDDGSYVGAGEVVTFNINGVFYNRTTNSSGYAKLNINLNPGDYIITAEYSGCKVSNIITVLPILSADDLEMSYKDGSTFDATLLDGQGNVYSNQKVSFNVNGVFYYRTTNLLGVASLNINLMSGEYIITSSYNGYNIANTILIK